MSDYKKIYQRLVKEIKKELELHRYDNNYTNTNNRDNFLDNIEKNYGITILEWLLSILPEIEGKKFQGVVMSKKEFTKWKKQIKGK